MHSNGEMRDGREKVIAVAIDKDKSSQQALKWAVEQHVVSPGKTIRLVYVLQRPPSKHIAVNSGAAEMDSQTLELFLPFRCFCTRRQINCEVVILEGLDVAKALIQYTLQYRVQTLLLGAPSKNGLPRLFRATNICGDIMKWAPDFCNVYVISKRRLSAARAASRPVPDVAAVGGIPFSPASGASLRGGERIYDEIPTTELDINSFSGRLSTDSACFNFYENMGSSMRRKFSGRSPDVDGINSELLCSGSQSPSNNGRLSEISTISPDRDQSSWPAQDLGGEMDDEMRRLKIELKQTMDMYHAACREALAARRKAMELEQWKMKEKKILQGAREMDETVSAALEREKSKCKAAIEAAEAAQKLVELEVQRRKKAELKALREVEEKRRVIDALGHSHVVLKYQSLYHILAVLFLFYIYFSLFS